MQSNTRQKDTSAYSPKGWRVYRIKGVDHDIVAWKGGPTAEEVKNKPSYQELRNNQKEFGAASILSKLIRSNLPEPYVDACESYVSGKLTARFRKMAQQEEGESGKRPICIAAQKDQIEGFNFNIKRDFSKIFFPKFFVKKGSFKGHVIFHFPSYIPQEEMNIPAGASHYKVMMQAVALSDFSHQSSTGKHEPLQPKINGISEWIESSMHLLCKMPIDPSNYQISLTPGEDLPDHCAIAVIMGIRFFEKKPEGFRSMEANKSLQILRVF